MFHGVYKCYATFILRYAVCSINLSEFQIGLNLYLLASSYDFRNHSKTM